MLGYDRNWILVGDFRIVEEVESVVGSEVNGLFGVGEVFGGVEEGRDKMIV